MFTQWQLGVMDSDEVARRLLEVEAILEKLGKDEDTPPYLLERLIEANEEGKRQLLARKAELEAAATPKQEVG